MRYKQPIERVICFKFKFKWTLLVLFGLDLDHASVLLYARYLCLDHLVVGQIVIKFGLRKFSDLW